MHNNRPALHSYSGKKDQIRVLCASRKAWLDRRHQILDRACAPLPHVSSVLVAAGLRGRVGGTRMSDAGFLDGAGGFDTTQDTFLVC